MTALIEQTTSSRSDYCNLDSKLPVLPTYRANGHITLKIHWISCNHFDDFDWWRGIGKRELWQTKSDFDNFYTIYFINVQGK